jgi:hypothetical protein
MTNEDATGNPVRGPAETLVKVVQQRLNDANRGNTVPITIEFAVPTVKAIDRLAARDESLPGVVRETGLGSRRSV